MEASRRSRSGGGKKRTGHVDGLTDFYKFQIKDGKRKGAEDLKEMFERDKKKVKMMMEERKGGMKQFDE